VAGADEKRPARGGSFGSREGIDRLESNAGDGRSRAIEVLLRGRISIAVEEQVLTAVEELVSAVVGEPVSIRVEELAGIGAGEPVAR
jgi:hypothetical protein